MPSRFSEASQASWTYSGRPLIPISSAVGVALVAELGRDHDLVAVRAEHPPEQLLVRPRAVVVGGVEQGHPELDRAQKRRVDLAVVGLPVELGHAHAADPLRRHDETLAPEYARLHELETSRTADESLRRYSGL